MTLGTPRREDTQDSLEGQAGMTPVSLQGPGVRTAAAPTAPDVSLSGNIARNLADWGSGRLQVAADINHKRSTFEGQMAYTQGQTFEQVQVGGDKWALEGYRVMDAQAVASTMLGAQRADIAQSGYELAPEEFRAQYTARIENIVKDLDPRTADLVREQMAAQMPTLVEDHTVKHVVWKEGQNYDSLARSIDVISRDPTATDALVAFAQGGEGSASAGLSEERRKSAVVDGVITAFSNDNPLAYASLAKAGLLGDNLTVDQQERLRSAKAGFENRMRTEYDEELFTSLQDLSTQVERGELTPPEAVEQLSVLYADHNITMNAADAGAIYSDAEVSNTNSRITRGVLIEEAGLRGDVDTQANLILDSLTGTESGGNAGAFRTNTDGRSFGGLIQMGQARIDEWAAATGNASMTPAEFSALPAGEQKAASLWHIKDLIAQAEATGAIGSTINGVTVTLSGLVAVAHLGGGAGMRKFVESGGEYNPEDELGTSLTDYLSTHGSGEMAELMSSQDRLVVARDLLTQTQEAVNLDAYRQTQLADAEADAAYRAGDMPRDRWLEQRAQNAAAYGYARTAADVQHELGVIADVRKTATDEAAVERADIATAKILDAQQTMKAVADNPASTPAQVTAAMSTLSQARAAIFDEAGIPMSQRNNSAYMQEAVATWDKYIAAHTKWSQEEADIANAVNTGTVSSLPKNLQTRAFDAQKATAQKTYSDAVAARQMTPEAASAALSAEYTNFYAKAGVVDPRVNAQMSAVMLAPMIDKDGNPNPATVSTVEAYAKLKAQNPRAAATMLDDEARVLAEAVMSRAADPSLYGEAVRGLGVEMTGNRRVEDSFVYMQRDDVQTEIDRQATWYLEERDIGKLHAIWQNDADWSQVYDSNYSGDNRIASPETRELVKAELSTEVARLQRINPNLKPRDLASMAADNVSRRTEVIGGDVVVMAPGMDIMSAMFGGRANEVDHDGAVNSAIATWLRDPKTQEQYGYLGGPSFSETLPGFVQSGIDSVASVFGGGFQPGMSLRDSLSYGATGLRPMRAYTTANGKGIVLEVLKADGNYSEPIVVPMKEVGELYMKQLKLNATQ